ncbi:homeobox-leucine zipper protein HOX18-like [Primulina huaijiensis]|uniref:homeobox-leucine zipper protein HOX18-like n=1 Tax=Primulina huaijiensis TaxID=1492673 RepID=UPI003CC7699F
MDEKDEASSIKLGLDLGLGLAAYEPKRDSSKTNRRVPFLDLSIPIHQNRHDTDEYSISSPKLKQVDEKLQGSKKRIFNGSKADDCERNYSKNCSRKKLRLEKDQITLLEESFEQHSSLSMAQKQLLAERLKLKPRQVEVWFQNRRAKTKMKQTEIDREFLKKNCERLSDENLQLKRQLLELRPGVKTENPPPPLRQFFNPMPKAVAAVHKTCPTCEKTWNNRGGAKQETATAAVMEVGHEDKLIGKAGLES